MVRFTRFVAAASVLSLVTFFPGSAEAQRPGAQVGRFEVPGFDFSPDGAWRKRTRQIRQARQSMLRSGSIASLNSPARMSRVSGTYNVPVILISFTNSAIPYSAAQYDNVLFNPAVNPYSVKSYYGQISNGNVTINGTVLAPIVTDNPGSFYEDNCNGIGITTCGNPLPNGVSSRFRDLLVEALTKNNGGAVDWGEFDNDGPDGNPNSGDDDGRVDFVTFIQPDVDGACGGNVHIWAHRFSLQGLGLAPFTTTTPRTGGGFIVVSDYTIQSGVGGTTACSASSIMPVGTIAHETGHAFGLPDLYDTNNQNPSHSSQGIGEWGIMGSGNYARPYSPSGYEAWSLAEMGWVAVDTLGSDGTIDLGPVQTTDTVLYVAVPGTDEYFLLENRDSLESDTAQMNPAHGTRKKSPGLLIWHIDQGIVNAGVNSNTVNDGPIHGVALEQADGLNELRTHNSNQRGNSGDAYPGTSVNRSFTISTNPAARDNQGASAGFIIDSIYRNASGVANVPSRVVFRFSRRGPSVFTTNRTGASIKVNSITTQRFDNIVVQGDNITLEAISPQTITAGRTQLTFASWSDGGAQTHTVVSGATPDTVVASFTANHRVNLVTAPIGGTVASDIGGSPNLVTGAFVAEGTPVTLTATPTLGGTFIRFQGDTTTTNATLVLPMGRPYSLTALFSGSVTIVTADAVNALLGATCPASPCMSPQQLTYMDQSGNNDGTYNLGDFLAYADRTGLNPSSGEMQRLLSQPTISVPLSAPTTPKER